MKIVPFNRSVAGQRRFVFSYFCRGTDMPSTVLHRAFLEGARAVVGMGKDVDPDNVTLEDPLYGFAIVTGDGRVLWIYVKVPVTLPNGKVVRFRGQGRAKRLLAALGFTRETPLPVVYDSPAARRWAMRGWKIVFPNPKPEVTDARPEDASEA